jgi:hypothetical protein
MRVAVILVPALAPLLAACASGADTAAEGSSTPAPGMPALVCEDRGLAPGTAEYDRCVAAERRRENAATEGVVDTLFRNATGPTFR